jgi:hypothetical protein
MRALDAGDLEELKAKYGERKNRSWFYLFGEDKAIHHL